MSDVSTTPISDSSWTAAVKGALSSRHFCFISVLLLVAALGWNTLAARWQIHFVKMPVSPPPAAKIDKRQRLVNFPAKLGPFELVEGSDKPQRDDMLEALGTTKNERNWYYMGLYVDKKANQAVQLSIIYYTGLQDAVPHVGERCIMASGGRIDYGSSGKVKMTCLGLPSVWSTSWSKVDMYRTVYETNKGRFCQYHDFSMNGEPNALWEAVRYELTKFWVKYCYFAKIEVASVVPDLPEKTCDELCQRFLSYALPSALQCLPTRQDVERAAAEKK